MDRVSAMVTRKSRTLPLSPISAALAYLALGVAWILSTDRLLEPWMQVDAEMATMLASIKGTLFVLISSVLVFTLTQLAVRQQKHRTLDAVERENQLKAIIETLPVPLLVVRRSDGQVLYANEWLARLTGHHGDAVVGRNCIDFYVDGDAQPSQLAGLGQTNEGIDHEIRYWAKGGQIRTAFMNAQPIRYQDEDALVVALVDITRRKTAEADLRRKHDVLEVLSELQERFISDDDAEALFGRLLRAALALTASRSGLIAEIHNRPDGSRTPVYRAGVAASHDDPLLQRVLTDDKPASQDDRIALPLHAGEELTAILVLEGHPGGYADNLFEELAPFFKSCGALISAFRNARRREEAEANLSKLSLAVEQSPSTVMITDRQGVIEYVNESFRTVTGYSSEEVIGQNPRILKSGYIPDSVFREMWSTLLAGQDWQGELYNKRKDGELYWSQLQISPIRSAQGDVTHLVATGEDISQRKRFEERLLQQANFDQLTGLPNRILAFDRLCQALNQAHRDQRSLTVMQVDLDHFKLINDSLGHSAGDAVLVEASRRLQSCIRKIDTVARLGSDEFLVVLADRSAEERADVVARRILDAFTHPFHLDGNELFISVSLGVSVSPDDGSDPELLLQNCGAAMTRAKESGRNTYSFFTPGMNLTAAKRLEIDAQLRHALDRDELFLHFQPLLDIAQNKLAGAEALIRWQNTPLGGLVMPDNFIPLAEDTGLIVPIGSWVLRQACLVAQQWRDRGLDLTMAVNTSSRQLRHGNLLEELNRALDESGLPPSSLEMEITESFLIEDPTNTGKILEKVANLGVRLSLDDFGTGYSSLSYLKKFPFHTLKIDRSFVRDIMTDPNDRALVRAIIAMAKSLNLKVIAEGVETIEQLDYLRDQGCDIAQGFYYSRPIAPEQFQLFAGI